MNNYFDELFKELVVDEGGYVNDKDDAGGETYLGITRRDHPNAQMWISIDYIKKTFGLTGINARLKAMPEVIKEAGGIYRSQYYNPIRLGELNSKKLVQQIFDHAVNAGVGAAIQLAYELVELPKSTKVSDLLINKLKEYGS